MNGVDIHVRGSDLELQNGVGRIIHTTHPHERLISVLTWVQVIEPFDGTTPALDVYAVAAGHAGDAAYQWSTGAPLASLDGIATAGTVDGSHHATDDALATTSSRYDRADTVFRDAGTAIYLRLTDGGYYAPGTHAVAPGSTRGHAVFHLTTWTPGAGV